MRFLVRRRSILLRCCKTLLKVALLVVSISFVVPVRNVVFYSILPGIWKEHSSLFLIRVMLDGQYFPVEEILLTPTGQNFSTKNFDGRYASKDQNFTAYYDRITLLQKMSTLNSESKSDLKELLKFRPQMSNEERAVVLFTLDVFVRACEASDLTYFLISGTALGSIRHHGMIPWDDDIDVIMNASEWKRIAYVLGQIPDFELFTPRNVQWKFFMKSLPQSNRPFKYPNVDIFFFNEDATHIWSQTWGTKPSLCNKKSDILPLKRRKFENWNLPVPRLMEVLLSVEFGDFNHECRTPGYIHKTNTIVSPTTIDCQNLHSVFPFVFRENSESGVTVELCKIAGQIVENVTVTTET